MEHELNKDQIKRDAEDRMTLPVKMDEVQALLDRFYNGYKISIVSKAAESNGSTHRTVDAPANSASNFKSLPGVMQMREILLGGSKTSVELRAEMRRRGSTVTDDTIQSTLSRKKTMFRRTTDGLRWALVGHAEDGTEELI